MRGNPQEAHNMFNNGHEFICRVLLVDFRDGKREEYLGALYWVYDNNDMAYHEILHVEPGEDNIQSFNRSVRTTIPDYHIFKEEHPNSDQQSQLPLGSVGLPPPRPMMPPPIPFGQVVTSAGRVDHSPVR